MKKINSLFSVIFFVFFTCNCFNFRDSFVYRHKKKIIGGVLFSMFTVKVYSTNKEFANLYYAFIEKMDADNKDTDAANQIEKKFEKIVHSMFLSPNNKEKFAKLIDKYRLNWTVTRDLITKNLISYQKK